MFDYKIMYNNIIIGEYFQTTIVFNKLKPIGDRYILDKEMKKLIDNEHFNTLFRFYGTNTSFDPNETIVLDSIYTNLQSIDLIDDQKLEIFIKDSSSDNYSLVLQTNKFGGIFRFQQADISVPTIQNQINILCTTI